MWKEKLHELIEFGEKNILNGPDIITTINQFIDKFDNFAVWGTGDGGLRIKKLLDKKGKKIAYYIDNDINKKGTLFEGKIVKHPSEIGFIDNKLIIASLWFPIISQQIENQFILIPFLDFIPAPFLFENINIGKEFLEKFIKGFDRISQVFNLLENSNSQTRLYNVIKYRTFLGYKNILFFETPYSSYPQYFHPLVKPEDSDIIVDAGAYDGDTILNIINQNISYKYIYAFEPDVDNYNKLLKNTSHYKNINCYDLGIWNKKEKLFFSSGATVGSAIVSDQQNANCTIDCISIDEFFDDKEKPTLIKMDIEGAEYEALLGAKNIISHYKPKLQICIYHRPEHLWDIPLFIKELVPEYKIYIGHHHHLFNETVLYARA